MTQRTKDKIERIVIPVLLGFALLGASVWGATRAAQAASYRSTAEAMYTRAFTELCGDFRELNVTLGKLQAVSTPAQTVLLLDDVWRLSGSGVSLMAQLPQSHVDTVEINRFLVRLGDYARALTKGALQGVSMTAEDREQLQSLYDTCTRLSDALQARLADGELPLAALTQEQFFTGAQPVAAQGGSDGSGTPSDGAASDGAAGNSAQSGAGEDGTKDKEGIDEFPTLIYDGPFSESAETATPKGLSGPELNEAQARAAAEKFAGVPVSAAGMANGRIPSYDFTGLDAQGRYIDVAVSVQGGRLVYLMGAATSDLAGKPPASETARYRDAAVSYLASVGYPDMRATYAQYYGGCALINCAATQNGVLLYNDLIKVWVDRESVKVVGVDARNYLMNHTVRTLDAPRLTLQEAESLLSDQLRVEDRALALIPLSPEREALCYEFKCTLGGNAYILYLNVEDGNEEQIFRIIDDEEGELVL